MSVSRRSIPWVPLAFIFSLAVNPFRLAAADPARWDKPLLWKIERQGFPISHLFGTIHLPDPRFSKFPGTVESALVGAEAVYTEIAMDISSMVAQSERLLLPEGQVIDEVLPEKLVGQLAEELRSISPELDLIPFQRYKPWALLMTLPLVEAQMKSPSALPMDLQIFQRATLGGKKTGGIETIDEQLGVFDQFTMVEQIRMLELQVDYLRHCRKQKRSWIGEMVRAYLNRDMKAMETASDEYLEGGGEIRPTDADRALHARLMAILLIERNRRMADRIDGLLSKNKTRHFIAAGALHFAGAEGLPALLEKKGWRVTPL
jgi:uncharacterized protein YbaP (TraB family)